jgi:hypothetical protein
MFKITATRDGERTRFQFGCWEESFMSCLIVTLVSNGYRVVIEQKLRRDYIQRSPLENERVNNILETVQEGLSRS